MKIRPTEPQGEREHGLSLAIKVYNKPVVFEIITFVLFLFSLFLLYLWKVTKKVVRGMG
jgi:hypothetical protein